SRHPETPFASGVTPLRSIEEDRIHSDRQRQRDHLSFARIELSERGIDLRRRHPHHSADARARQHSANAAVPQRNRRGNAKRIGGELEKSRPTASTSVRKLIGLTCPPDCPRFVPGVVAFWLRGPAASGTCGSGATRRNSVRGGIKLRNSKHASYS